MKFIIISFLILGCSNLNLDSNTDKKNKSYLTTSSIPIPNNTTPYGTNMCKGKEFVPAYGFVVKGSEFNKKR